jgi:nucleotide-binding universal stress UspA family protein
LERPERLLVPFDFSPAAESALKAGLQLAKEYDARLDLLHVISPPIDVTGYGLTMPSSPYLEVTGELTKMLDQRLAAIDSNIQVRSHVQHGSPGSEIIRFAAEKDSDLIVIGSHGLRGMTRWLLGSVAEKVIRGAECPVLVLRGGAEEASSDAASDET